MTPFLNFKLLLKIQKDVYTLFCILSKTYHIVLQGVNRCLLKGFWIINIPGYKKGLIQEK